MGLIFCFWLKAVLLFLPAGRASPLIHLSSGAISIDDHHAMPPPVDVSVTQYIPRRQVSPSLAPRTVEEDLLEFVHTEEKEGHVRHKEQELQPVGRGSQPGQDGKTFEREIGMSKRRLQETGPDNHGRASSGGWPESFLKLGRQLLVKLTASAAHEPDACDHVDEIARRTESVLLGYIPNYTYLVFAPGEGAVEEFKRSGAVHWVGDLLPDHKIAPHWHPILEELQKGGGLHPTHPLYDSIDTDESGRGVFRIILPLGGRSAGNGKSDSPIRSISDDLAEQWMDAVNAELWKRERAEGGDRVGAGLDEDTTSEMSPGKFEFGKMGSRAGGAKWAEDWDLLSVGDRHFGLESKGWGRAGAGVGKCRMRAVGEKIVEAAVPQNHMAWVLSWLSKQNWVHWLEPRSRARLHNMLEGAVLQNGEVDAEPLTGLVTENRTYGMARPIWSAGIMGQGQIVGVGDSGVDVNSCFFRDDKQTDPPWGPNHRKIQMYLQLEYGDYLDGDGHGSHVAGSIAGQTDEDEDNSIFSGMAPFAKLVVSDMGEEAGGYISPPDDLDAQYFPLPYENGARIHSNSWGTNNPLYDGQCQGADKFLYQHPDFVALFASGNLGVQHDKGPTIFSPGNAKNVITVGATYHPKGSLVYKDGRYLAMKIEYPNRESLLLDHEYFPIQEHGYGVTFGNGTASTEVSLADPRDACKALTSQSAAAARGKILLVVKGNCVFTDKFDVAQRAGAVAVIVIDNGSVPGLGYFPMESFFGPDTSVTLPGGSVSAVVGQVLLMVLTSGGSLNVSIQPLGNDAARGVLRHDNMALFSSWGPVSDGRIKPEIAAPGESVSSARSAPLQSQGPSCKKRSLSGTSMSTPLSAGALALVRQYFMDGYYPTGTKVPQDAFEPSGVLLKATLINGASAMKGVNSDGVKEDIPPSFSQGFGRINLINSIPLVNANITYRLVAIEGPPLKTRQGQRYCLLSTPNGVDHIKVTLTWYDPPGMTAAGIALVNNLDLAVIAPGPNFDPYPIAQAMAESWAKVSPLAQSGQVLSKAGGEGTIGDDFAIESQIGSSGSETGSIEKAARQQSAPPRPRPGPGHVYVGNANATYDNINNVEQVWITHPLQGVYRVEVYAALVAMPGYKGQSFALAATGPIEQIPCPYDGLNITRGPNPVGKANNATFFLGTPTDTDVSMWCRLTSSPNSTFTHDWEPCAQFVAYSPLPDASYSFQVQGRDQRYSNTLFGETIAWNFTVDTVLPKIRFLAYPPEVIPWNTTSILFFSSKPSTTFSCSFTAALDAGPVRQLLNGGNCESPILLKGLADGKYNFSITASDNAGNQATEIVTFTVDTIPPMVTSLAVDVLMGKGVATAKFGADDGAVGSGLAGFVCRLLPISMTDTSNVIWAPCGSPWGISPVFAGNYEFQIRPFDAIGNMAEPSMIPLSVPLGANAADGSGLTAVSLLPPLPAQFTNQSSALIRFESTSPSTAGFMCTGPIISDTAGSSSCGSPIRAKDLSDGQYLFTVQAKDAQGIKGPVAGYAWTVDTLGPLTGFSPSFRGLLSPTLSVAFSIEAGEEAASAVARIECMLSLHNDEWVGVSNPAIHSWRMCRNLTSYEPLQDGLYKFTARSYDLAGNVGPGAAPWIFLVNEWILRMQGLRKGPPLRPFTLITCDKTTVPCNITLGSLAVAYLGECIVLMPAESLVTEQSGVADVIIELTQQALVNKSAVILAQTSGGIDRPAFSRVFTFQAQGNTFPPLTVAMVRIPQSSNNKRRRLLQMDSVRPPSEPFGEAIARVLFSPNVSVTGATLWMPLPMEDYRVKDSSVSFLLSRAGSYVIVAESTATTPGSTLGAPPSSSSKIAPKDLRTEAIIGGVLGGVAGIILLVLLVVVVTRSVTAYKRRQSFRERKYEQAPTSPRSPTSPVFPSEPPSDPNSPRALLHDTRNVSGQSSSSAAIGMGNRGKKPLQHGSDSASGEVTVQDRTRTAASLPDVPSTL